MKFVEDEKINAQINHIFKLNRLGKTDQQIAEFFMHNKEMNFKINKIQWTEGDIKTIRKDFEVRYNVWKKGKEQKVSGPKYVNTPKTVEQVNEIQKVAITDIDMPFLSMVEFMIKFALAAIPATIIFSIIIFGFMAIFGMFGVSR